MPSAPGGQAGASPAEPAWLVRTVLVLVLVASAAWVAREASRAF